MARDAGALIRSLVGLRAERRTGVFEVTAEGVKTSIFLMDGSPVFVEEEPNLETLGRLLLRHGTITGDQYEATIREMADALDEDEPLRFGAIAIERGFIDGDQLNDALADQARWRLVRAFQRTDHEWRLDDRGERVEGVPLYELAIEPAVLLALRSSPDEELSSVTVPPALAARATSVPVLCADAAAISQTFALGPSERAYVAMIDGSRSLADCMRMGSAMVDRPAVLSALLLTRAIKLTDPASASDGGPPSSSRTPVVKIVMQATAPNAQAPSAQAPIAQAPSPKAASPASAKAAHAARLNAELAFQKGKNLLRAGRPDAALEELRRAQTLDSTPEIELHAQWCELEATKRPPTEAQRADLQRLALALTRHDADNAFAAYVIGRIAALEGRAADSKRWLERAFRLDPKLREAESERKLLTYDANADASEKEPPSSKRGLFGLFRRNDK